VPFRSLDWWGWSRKGERTLMEKSVRTMSINGKLGWLLAGWLAGSAMALPAQVVSAGLEKRSRAPGLSRQWDQSLRCLQEQLRAWEQQWKGWGAPWRPEPPKGWGPDLVLPPLRGPDGAGALHWRPPWSPPRPPGGRVWGSRTVNGWTVWIVPCGPDSEAQGAGQGGVRPLR
jgi:hypothetical protein